MGKSVIDGRWDLVRAELSGEAAPDMITSKTEFELLDGSYFVRYAGEIMDRGSFEVAESTPFLVLRGLEGPNAGRTIPCIYQLVGSRLRVCYGLTGVVPAEFSTVSGDNRYLAVYRRHEG